MKALLEKFRSMNFISLAALMALVAMGCVFIRSAALARDIASIRELWQTHLSTAVAAFGLYFILAAVDYRKILDWCSIPFFGVSIVFLVAVLVFGSEIYGGKRWLWFFQPSEISKLAVIMLTAQIFGRPASGDSPDWRSSFRGFAAACAVLGIPAALILAEPDLGTTLVLVPAVLAMLLAARVWLKGILTLCCIGVFVAGSVLGAVCIAENQPTPERRDRILEYVPLQKHQIRRLRVFVNPKNDIRGAGYNLHQARLSIGSGMFGKGVGNRGGQKALGYLPPSVSINDFIFAVLAEESGFFGSSLMLLLFLALLLSGLHTALRADDDRGRLYAIGILTLIFCHVWENVAMSIGLMPITGLPLPFISAGRTFLIVLMAGLGILQSVHVHRSRTTGWSLHHNPKE